MPDSSFTFQHPLPPGVDWGGLSVGIFGGSFNPIHTGHIQLAKQILDKARLDQVWFMVSPLNPFKKATLDLLDDHLRLQMARRALYGEPHLIATDYEFHLSKPSYTWSTLLHLSTDYPSFRFSLIIGADNWLAFDRWAKPDFILSHYNIIVYPRDGFPIDPATLPSNVTLVNTTLYPVSSTEIRQRVRRGESIDGLVPPAIVGMIRHYY